MDPALELVQIGHGESFKAWEHGLPFHTVRWHFHPEYELHHVVDTTGHCFVGDYIGAFEPGQLVLTGPNLPHNWVSSLPGGAAVPLRGRVLQFTEGFVAGTSAVIPELAACAGVLAASKRGLLFAAPVARSVGPLLAELVQARGVRRVELFFAVLGALTRGPRPRTLASAAYLPDPPGTAPDGMNAALAFINDHLTEPFREADLAAIAGRSPSAFSRGFRRHTGMPLVHYVNRLRINLACQMLMDGAARPITEVCYAAGYNTLSNFNRQFQSQKGMPPSRFRALLAENRLAA